MKKIVLTDILTMLSKLWIYNMAGMIVTIVLSYDATTGVEIWSNITPILYLAQLTITMVGISFLAIHAYSVLAPRLIRDLKMVYDEWILRGLVDETAKSEDDDGYESDVDFELPIEAENLFEVNIAGLPDTEETAIEVAKMVLLTQLPEEVQTIVPCIEGDLGLNPTIKALRAEMAEDKRPKFDALLVALDNLESGKIILKTNGVH